MRFHSLAEWLSWQEGLHLTEIDLGLERVAAVLRRMAVQIECPVITVAGTNGKGSSVAMLEAIFLAAGYRVGAYTSPHFLKYNERVRLNGEPVADADLCQAFERIDQARSDDSLSYFEFGTLAAIDIFAATPLDVVILEVGLGGRLDATNIIDADVALITPIAVDHVDWLGSDREQIGREKAGIMRTGRPAVCSDRAMPDSIRYVATEIGAGLVCLGRDFDYSVTQDQWRWQSEEKLRDALPAPALRGAFQHDNAAAVIMVLETLHARLPVSQAQLREGLANVSLPGRFQVIPGESPIVLDVAHNPHAARSLAANLQSWPMPGRTYALTAMMADKDLAGIISPLLDEFDHWCISSIDMPRAATAEQLTAVVSELGVDVPVETVASVAAGLQHLLGKLHPHDRIVVFGSFYTVAEAMQAAYNAGLTESPKRRD